MKASHFDIKEFCSSIYSEICNIKEKVDHYSATIGLLHGAQREALGSYIKHLDEISGFLEWKLEIFSKICPVDFAKYVGNVESVVSVPVIDTKLENTAAGFFGG